MNSKFSILKKQILFSIRVKESFEPIRLRKKKGAGFLLFLKAFSLETDHPDKFHGKDMSGILFFIFASCEPLRFHAKLY